MIDVKRVNGQYYTAENPFKHEAFREWAALAGLPRGEVLEPFAGSNHLIEFLSDLKLVRKYRSFDIMPAHHKVQKKDTLTRFPQGFEVCVTNPPWLARNSATLRGISFPDCQYDDLYKLALEKCLSNCPWVASLVPESFIRAEAFHDRLISFVSLPTGLFKDTTHPTGLAMFGPDNDQDTVVWSGKIKVGKLSTLKNMRPLVKSEGALVRFNIPNGNVGLIALDNTQGPSIRFCHPRELNGYNVKHSGRHITKIKVGGGGIEICKWNDYLSTFREKTLDTLMTCYKGVRKDGMYRRRCDWELARGIIHNA